MNRKPDYLIFIRFVLFVTFANIACAQTTDTPEARKLAARRYLQLVPLKTMLEETVQQSTKNIPRDQKKQARAIIDHVDMARIENAAAKFLAEHLTLKELQALTARLPLKMRPNLIEKPQVTKHNQNKSSKICRRSRSSERRLFEPKLSLDYAASSV